MPPREIPLPGIDWYCLSNTYYQVYSAVFTGLYLTHAHTFIKIYWWDEPEDQSLVSTTLEILCPMQITYDHSLTLTATLLRTVSNKLRACLWFLLILKSSMLYRFQTLLLYLHAKNLESPIYFLSSSNSNMLWSSTKATKDRKKFYNQSCRICLMHF